ncbi:MAG: FeoB-associated Cys-rich membrane protein [Clostridiaceae bacterium]|jgi:hypothetical protein|nr:FeoB-associated Cys-rich membrane protein [Clostridiaceae bacterium]
MLSWIAANIGTIIVSAVLIVIVSLVIIGMVRDKKKGKSPCGGKCGGCPSANACHDR